MGIENKIRAGIAVAVIAGGISGASIANRGFASSEGSLEDKIHEPQKALVQEPKTQPQTEPQVDQTNIIDSESKSELAPGLVRIPAGSKIDTSFWKPEAKQMVYGENRPSIVSGNIKIISAPYYGAIYQDLTDGSLYATEIGDRPDYILPEQPINAWGWKLWQEGGKYVLSVTTTRTVEQWSSYNGRNWSLDSSYLAPMPR